MKMMPVNPVNYYGASKRSGGTHRKTGESSLGHCKDGTRGMAWLMIPRRSNIITWVKSNLEQKKKTESSE